MRSLLLPGRNKRTARPASGVSKTIESKCWSIVLPHRVIAEEGQDAHHYKKCVCLHPSRLQQANRVGEHLYKERTEPHRAIDDPGVPPAGQTRRGPRKPARAVDAAVHH